MSDFGWSYWEDADLVSTEDDGARIFSKEGFECYCPAGVEPGDAASTVYSKLVHLLADDENHDDE